MRLFTLIKVRKIKKQVRREELKKQEQLMAKYAHRLDSHGFPMRTHWPD